MRVSYNGYYAAFPRLRRGFDSLYPHQIMTTRAYFHDKKMFSLFVISILITLIGILAIILRIHTSEVLVPIRYLATNDIQRANWLNLYQFAVFLGLSCFMHIYLSMKLYHIKKGYSYAVLIGFLLLAVLTIRISGAVISLYY